jgi:malonate-semialdehyde dehydrogenase (acetylating) / methylmalonate-semialdehyde dehydrogenase
MSGQISGGIDCYSVRPPLGVAGITPFNFPFMVPRWMFPIALAAGNACVCKPSEQDPSALVRTAELLSEAGLPDGVYNVVHVRHAESTANPSRVISMIQLAPLG